MQRIASVIHLRPEMKATYLELHHNPPLEVLEILKRAGVQNYSIFLHGDLLFSYLEFTGDDWNAAQLEIAADPATGAWWRRTDPCQRPLEGAPEGAWWTQMPSVFFLE